MNPGLQMSFAVSRWPECPPLCKFDIWWSDWRRPCQSQWLLFKPCTKHIDSLRENRRDISWFLITSAQRVTYIKKKKQKKTLHFNKYSIFYCRCLWNVYRIIHNVVYCFQITAMKNMPGLWRVGMDLFVGVEKNIHFYALKCSEPVLWFLWGGDLEENIPD